MVLKAQAAALSHKTEAGGVMLNLADEAAVRAAWDTLVKNVKRAAPDVTLDGALVEKMSPKGVELMVGAKRDPGWGTVLLLGLGGIWVEALGDVQLLPGGRRTRRRSSKPCASCARPSCLPASAARRRRTSKRSRRSVSPSAG